LVRAIAGSAYLPGTVQDMEGDRLLVQYAPGDQEWAALGRVRFPRPGEILPDEAIQRGLRATGRSRAQRKSESLSPPAPWAVGDRVWACWFDLLWYPGVIYANLGDRLHVLLDDGNQAVVTPQQVRPLEVAAGDRVLGRWKGGAAFYPAEVASL